MHSIGLKIKIAKAKKLFDKMKSKITEAVSPESRWGHESALIGDELYLFGGKKGSYRAHYFPRNEIWTCNVREGRNWTRRLAGGKVVPPPCVVAQCVVINGIIYSYGGWKEGGYFLGEVFGLDPGKMSWTLLTTPSHEKKPWQRAYCCLWAIGGRMIMFGGWSGPIPPHRLQTEARCDAAVNNEIYEFVFTKEGDKGCWSNIELSGERPQPRSDAAMETIDEHRGLVHGGYGCQSLDDSSVIDLKQKKWICIEFFPNPFARYNHRLCRLPNTGIRGKLCFVLLGGDKGSKFQDYAYILDVEKRKSYSLHLMPGIVPINSHTLHCFENKDGSSQIILTGGKDLNYKLKTTMMSFTIVFCLKRFAARYARDKFETVTYITSLERYRLGECDRMI
ncbi:uncharacterized protein [Oscarella lobularis]|uniref:uncharacterized protein n=1 Tax=Oscarella lobularis TaxID=121494 RepID=UPI003313AAB0